MATKAPWIVCGYSPIWQRKDNSYMGIGGCDIDGDGVGGRVDNDPTWQPATTYKPDLNSKLVRGFVCPGKLARSFSEKVIGCQGRITLISTGVRMDAVVWDIGPDEKFGEQTIKAAIDFGVVNPSPTYGGTTEPLFLYEFWPGRPAVVDGVVYNLQSL